ncbi:MAG: DNA mismatch repair endonuclease MutL [Prevotellaceae bacterium]|nr:DNA mismatch repair endonuclease MutL [Candidatus Minthosoma caballi]
MDDIIHLLPDSVANKIAAGEVVQRPSSIIKEMVENSLDAGAENIQVLVVDGGKASVQVIDDGKGMSETDARLSFERHATSKIKEASDLFNLTTMGFRGEALASIAAVAQVELKTRRPEDELGTFLRISGSHIETQEPIACPAGCNFSVKNLFYNVPARRKFLKSNQTELANVVTDFQRIVLVHPEVAFTLYNNGVEMSKLPKASVRQRIIDVFGKKINADLLPLEVDTSIVSISGYVGKPESSKKKGTHQYFFVNGRFMRHAYFHKAVMKAYENLIPVGESVSYFIYFSVEPSSIDINVHPSKIEIKFDNEQAIWQVLFAAVKETIGKFSNVPMIDFDTEGRPDIPVIGAIDDAPNIPQMSAPSYNPFKISSKQQSYSRSGGWEKLYDGVDADARNSGGKDLMASSFSAGTIDGIIPDSADMLLSRSNFSVQNSEQEGGHNIDLCVKNEDNLQPSLWNLTTDESIYEKYGIDITAPKFQHRGQYIICPSRNGLMVVDQHRAHVRVLFEQNMRCLNSHPRPTQKELFPAIVQFDNMERFAFEGMVDDLSSLGFELSNLGGGAFSVIGVPGGIEGLNVDKLLHDIVAAVMEKTANVKTEAQESIAFTMAKSAAIVKGQVLSSVEMEHLLKDLFETKSPARTPDGKLVYSEIGSTQIDALF